MQFIQSQLIMQQIVDIMDGWELLMSLPDYPCLASLFIQCMPSHTENQTRYFMDAFM